jgi:hypothetical protein
MSGYTLTQKEYKALRASLTRAKKKGPDAVIAECNHALAIFEERGYPDSWHDWERAKGDAETAKRYAIVDSVSRVR